MKLRERLDNYLYDKEYKIIIKENYVNIINYDEIVDFSLNGISVKYQNKMITLEGYTLTISRMVVDELIVIGKITNIRIN